MKSANIYRKIINYINLGNELDSFDNIHESIVKDSVFRGTNLWILVFAIIIASVGLNMNSTAVIIGAMLISPLMGPINGMGYSLATHNFELFRQAFKNFLFAVLAGLIASTAYFALSPISTAHSELLARTSPTIYDVLIALFGGMAGIVAISSRQKGNVIPGVAIATALMPPLCTAGYGLATVQFNFFFGAFYLFTINTVFIALSSVIVSQILKFPIRTLVNPKQKKRVYRIISVVIILVLLPSIYFGYDLVQKENFSGNALKYISNINFYEGNYLLKNEINSSKKSINLVYGGLNMNEFQKQSIINKAKDFNLGNVNINIQQGLAIDNFDKKDSEVLKLRKELNLLSLQLKEKESQIDSIAKNNQFGEVILNEIKNLYPQIKGCAFAEVNAYNEKIKAPNKKVIVLFDLNKSYLAKSDKIKINKWLETRLGIDEIEVIYQNLSYK